jgi:hypothetical protein
LCGLSLIKSMTVGGTMSFHLRIRSWLAFAVTTLLLTANVHAWEMSGEKTIYVHPREGQALRLGSVHFRPAADGKIAFALDLDHKLLKDYFLSMKEFKCLEGGPEIQCHVPYPHANPAAVTKTDLAWLEHALLFLFKMRDEFGAKLWNGIYYKMTLTDRGIVGTPEAIDLNFIGAPPDDTITPPYGPGERSPIAANARWFGRLTIE